MSGRVFEVVVGAAAGDRSRFGESVPGEDAFEGEFLAHTPDELDRDVGCTGDADVMPRSAPQTL